MDFKGLSTQELAQFISPPSEAYLELKNMGVLRTKMLLGN
jgi:hypothetical protein